VTPLGRFASTRMPRGNRKGETAVSPSRSICCLDRLVAEVRLGVPLLDIGAQGAGPRLVREGLHGVAALADVDVHVCATGGEDVAVITGGSWPSSR
jgi:hypothetical protein